MVTFEPNDPGQERSRPWTSAPGQPGDDTGDSVQALLETALGIPAGTGNVAVARSSAAGEPSADRGGEWAAASHRPRARRAPAGGENAATRPGGGPCPSRRTGRRVPRCRAPRRGAGETGLAAVGRRRAVRQRSCGRGGPERSGRPAPLRGADRMAALVSPGSRARRRRCRLGVVLPGRRRAECRGAVRLRGRRTHALSLRSCRRAKSTGLTRWVSALRVGSSGGAVLGSAGGAATCRRPVCVSDRRRCRNAVVDHRRRMGPRARRGHGRRPICALRLVALGCRSPSGERVNLAGVGAARRALRA